MTNLFLSFLFLVSISFSQPLNPVKISLPSGPVTLVQGSTASIIMSAEIEAPWHINSNAPHDPSLIASRVSVAGEGITLAKSAFPAAHDRKFEFSDQPVSVFEGRISVTLTLLASVNAAPGERTVTVKFLSQACNDQSCLAPRTVTATLVVKVTSSSSASSAPSAVNSSSSSSSSKKVLSKSSSANSSASSANSAVKSSSSSSSSKKALAPSSNSSASSAPSAVKSSSSSSSSKKALAPSSNSSAPSANSAVKAPSSSSSSTKAPVLATYSSAPSAVESSSSSGSLSDTLEKSGLALSLLLIFLGGLALNLTPCVYPLIPITIGYFGGQSEGSTGRLFLLGLLYMLGMALTYSVIGVVTSLSGALFGTLLQNVYVIIGIAALFVVLALSQFGVYEFNLPSSWMAAAGGAKGGAFGAFFMGLTMGIVAAPCIGPFVLGLVTFVAAKGDPFQGFLMFFVMAVGLGLPYLVLALFSGKLKNLPRSGEWMEGVKHLFGFVMLGMALYFVGPLLPKSLGHVLLPAFGLLAVIILLFIDKTGNRVSGFRYTKFTVGALVAALSIYTLIPAEKKAPEWKPFTVAAYEASLANHEPMVIDFAAEWCIPCKELDALTFSDPSVIAAMGEFTVYKADLTSSDAPEVEALVQRFGIKGVPTILIIDAQGTERHRITGFLDAKAFLAKLQP